MAFVERGYSLLSERGTLGYIVPNKFAQADYGVGMRRLIRHSAALAEFVDFGAAQVFAGATTYCCLLFLAREGCGGFEAAFNASGRDPKEFLRHARREFLPHEEARPDPWALCYSDEAALLQRVEGVSARLPDLLEASITGVKTGANNILLFQPVEETRHTVTALPLGSDEPVELERALLAPFCKASALKRYTRPRKQLLLLYPYVGDPGASELIDSATMARDYPLNWAYLLAHRRTLEGRQKGRLAGPSWYGLSFASSVAMFHAEKIVTPTLAPLNSFTVDPGGMFFPQGAGGGCGLVTKPGVSPLSLVALLNSRLLTFYFQRVSSRFQGGWFAYEPRYLRRIPVPREWIEGTTDKASKTAAGLARHMLSLCDRRGSAKLPHDKKLIQQEIDRTDREIDQLVYELYGLTDDEIRIVEEATAPKARNG